MDPSNCLSEPSEEKQMEQALLRAYTQKGPQADLSPEWTKSVLLEAGFDAEAVEETVERMTIQRKLQEVLVELATSVTRERSFWSKKDTSPLGYATPERVKSLLEGRGLDPQQIEKALEFLEKQKTMTAEPVKTGQARQNGGYVVAYEDSTDRPLWCLQVYKTKYDEELETDIQDVFITSLQIHDDKLIVKAEQSRSHVIDIYTRQVLR